MIVHAGNRTYDDVQRVAIYLRKSRDESGGTEDVLSNHRNILMDYIERTGGVKRLEFFEEIGTSRSIDHRPEMLRLLNEVSLGAYDAILVVDLDRVSRGEPTEWERIQKCLIESETILVTPTQAFDFKSDDLQLSFEIQQMMSRHEYKMNRKRMQRGKVEGTKSGRWTNGRPPFPYYYFREKQEVRVDEEQLAVYNFMKELCLQGVACKKIAEELNRREIYTPRGRRWSDTAVYRILTSEIHLGKVIYGKTSGSGHRGKDAPLRVKDRNQWIVSDGAHPGLKTQEEHERIIELLRRRRLIPTGARKGVHVFSGLIRCRKCGHTMKFQVRPGKVTLVRCQHRDPFGNRCQNPGMNFEFIEFIIQQALQQFLDSIMGKEPTSPAKKALENTIKISELELKSAKKRLERNEELWVNGAFLSIDKYVERKKQQEAEIEQKRDEIVKLKQRLEDEEAKTELLNAIQLFKKEWTNYSHLRESDPTRLNALAKKIIKSIEYDGSGPTPRVNIIYHV